jgi:CCR4-NOT transcription complex subunit 9
MHPNSHLHQYLQQSSLGGIGGANNSNSNPLQQPNTNMNNALSQHFPPNNNNNNNRNVQSNDPFVYAAQQQQQMMNSNTQMPMSAANNFVLQQQQQQQQQQHEQKLQQLDEEKIYGLVVELLNPATREQALLDLSKKREQYEDLALVLWYSYGKCF